MMRRLLISIGAVLLAFFVLLLSLWRTNQSMIEGRQASRSTHGVGQRLLELFTPPILPDSPLYVLPMVAERLSLATAPTSQQFTLRIAYADERLRTAHQLVDRGEMSLALTTLTKAEKYVLRAMDDEHTMSGSERVKAQDQLRQTIDVHIQTIALMKHAFSDAQKATIDSLIEQLTSAERFL